MHRYTLVLITLVFFGCTTSPNENSTPTTSAPHPTHKNHSHQHSDDSCGHDSITHHEHIDYLHDGHFHYVHDGHIDEHGIKASDRSTASVLKDEVRHDAHSHKHGEKCGHEKVKHDDHFDFIHGDHYHHVHHDHIDEHGLVVKN